MAAQLLAALLLLSALQDGGAAAESLEQQLLAEAQAALGWMQTHRRCWLIALPLAVFTERDVQ